MKADETEKLRSVQENLVRRFGDRLSPEEIRGEVDRAGDGLQSARLRSFVPVLVQRRAAEALRRRADASPR